MPGRKYSADGTYRYGFNGKENDNEVKGEGNQQDYGFRIYDTRIGKFLSVDPLIKKFPELTPYQFASNRPIDGIDWDGKEWKTSTKITKSDGIIITETEFTINIRVINQSTVITSPDKIKVIADNIAKGIEDDFTRSEVDLTDNNEIHIVKTKVVLDYTPLKSGEPAPTHSNGFWLVLDDKTTKTRVNSAGDEETYMTAGTARLGETQNNLIRVGITEDGRPISKSRYTRTGSHEIGHTGNLPHPWMLDANNARGIYDVQTYEAKKNSKGIITRIINKIFRKTAKDNLMNSDENPEVSERKNDSRKLTDVQIEVIRQTVEQQQPKK